MKIRFLDKIAAIGALLSASSCPLCLPLLASAGVSAGLGFLMPYGKVMMYIFQTFVILALIGNIISFLNHRKVTPLAIGIISPILIFFALYIKFIPILIYSGLSGLLASAILNYIANRKCKKCKVVQSLVTLKSKIRCPLCGYIKEEAMPVDSCQFSYQCSNCKKILRPKDGDCCVFCSYGSSKCPPKQKI